MKRKKFDVFVIGSGVAGKTVAENCAAEGLKVAIAEDKKFGGTCSNHGCDPKKVLLGPTEILQCANDLMGKGVEKPPKLNWKKLQKFKRTFTSDIPKRTKEDFEEKQIKMFSSSPKFIGPNSLQLKDIEVKADKIVIATGLAARKLNVNGSKYLKDSDDFLSLKKLPKQLIFIGAGYIGMEFAQMAARAGSKVTVMDDGDRPLSTFDKDLTALIEKTSEELGIKFIYNADLNSIQKKNKKFIVHHKIGNKQKSKKAHLIFNTTGRVPSIEKLDLETGNIDFKDDGIVVDDYLRSKTNPSVYACGDVSDHSLPLSPLASYEASTVSRNILKENSKKIDAPWVPSVVFTIPNLASVGYSEEEASKRYKNVTAKYDEVSNWYNNKRINGGAYAYKILINERTDLIVGAHLVGPEAAEMINIFTMAMNLNIKATQIKKMIFTYPSWTNDIKSMLA